MKIKLVEKANTADRRQVKYYADAVYAGKKNFFRQKNDFFRENHPPKSLRNST